MGPFKTNAPHSPAPPPPLSPQPTSLPPHSIAAPAHETKTRAAHQTLEGCQARACWDSVVASSAYEERKLQVAEFNARNR